MPTRTPLPPGGEESLSSLRRIYPPGFVESPYVPKTAVSPTFPFITFCSSAQCVVDGTYAGVSALPPSQPQPAPPPPSQVGDSSTLAALLLLVVLASLLANAALLLKLRTHGRIGGSAAKATSSRATVQPERSEDPAHVSIEAL